MNKAAIEKFAVKEVIRWLAAYQLHGNFTPGRISTYRLLSLPATAHAQTMLLARTVTEQEYH